MRWPRFRRQPKPVPCCPHCPGGQAPQVLTVKFDGGNEQEFVNWLRKRIRIRGGGPQI